MNDHYIGTPDPSKYLQGTNFLSEVELKQEIEDGNLLPIKVGLGCHWRTSVGGLFRVQLV